MDQPELDQDTLDEGSWGLLTMKLEAGKFYISVDGFVWCCYKIDMKKEEHAQADCIRLYDNRIEYFYLDGRYDSAGNREHTLRACPRGFIMKEDGSTQTLS